MADYTLFPFDLFTTAELFALMKESKIIGDDEFIKVCVEVIRKRPPTFTVNVSDVIEKSQKDIVAYYRNQ